MAVDADPSSPVMNCYVDLAYADSYFALKFGAANWAEFDQPVKESLIVSATRQLDVFEYGGMKVSKTQPLKWPRSNIMDSEGYTLPTIPLPHQLKDATCELAFWYWTEDDRFFTDVDLKQVQSYEVGPLKVDQKNPSMAFPEYVLDLIESIGPGVVIDTGDVAGQGKAKSMNMWL